MASAAAKHGDPMNASFTTIPVPLYDQGPQASANYLEVPLTGCVDSVLSVAKKSSVYVVGFRLEADVSHSGRVRCFVQSIVTGVNGDEPQVRFNPEPMQGEFVPDGKRFMSMAPIYTPWK
ncbi:hypothetical protein ColKHC_07985 [Colletotrichum higginsianum]|nr:hypothetical protein ColKHC_07985 [Colletotrichum higginsianum]